MTKSLTNSFWSFDLQIAAVSSVSAAHIDGTNRTAEIAHIVHGAAVLAALLLIPLAASLQTLEQGFIFHVVGLHFHCLFGHVQSVDIISQTGISHGRKIIPAGRPVIHAV